MPILNDRGAFYSRTLPDGRVIDVIPILFGQARLCISSDAKVQWYDAVY